MTNFYGKYRGKVVNNIDPLMLGRLITIAPAVSNVPFSRVRSMGQPVLLQDSQAICTPTGTPLVVASAQERVK